MSRNLSIKAKLFILILIPSFAFLFYAGTSLLNSKNNLNHISEVSKLLDQNSAIVNLILNLQRERGLSGQYLRNNTKKNSALVVSQKLQTDKFINILDGNLNKKTLENITKLQSVRQAVSNNSMQREDIFQFYTDFIANLFMEQKPLISISDNKEISKGSYQNLKLLLAIESASQEIELLNEVFARKYLTIEDFQKFSFVHVRQIENLNDYKILSNQSDKDIYKQNEEYNYFTSLLIKQLSNKTINENTTRWHQISIQRLIKLIILHSKEEERLKLYLENMKNELNSNFTFTIFLILFVFLTILLFSKVMIDRFLFTLNQLKKGIDDFILFIIYRNKKIVDMEINSNDEISEIAKNINQNRKLIEACFKCDEMVIKEVSKAVRNAKNDIHLVQEIKCFADNIMLENMKFDFNEMIEILRLKTDELILYEENLEQSIQAKTSELAKVNETLQISHKVLEEEKVRLSNFSKFLSDLNSVNIQALADKTLSNICNASGALFGYFMIYENEQLKVLASQAANSHILKENDEFITSSPLILDSLKQNKIIDIEDIEEDILPPVNIGFSSIRLNNFYSFPLVFQDKPLGVIILASAKYIDKEYLKGYILALIGSLNNAISYNYIQEQTKVLEKANIELKESDKMKSEFLANMSHELRTPLNSVIGFSGVLMKNKKKNLEEKQLDQLSKIRNNGKHLLGLINNILDLSKIESGKVELELTEINIIQFIEETIGMVQGQAVEKKIKLSFNNQTDEDEILITTDDTKLRQVVLNLIGNAIKFVSREKGEVKVLIYYENNNLLICINDNGIGIPEDKLKVIFKPFRQADGSTTRKFGGTGLGLAISKNIIQLLGGNIAVDSTPDVGSTFCISLPHKQIKIKG